VRFVSFAFKRRTSIIFIKENAPVWERFLRVKEFFLFAAQGGRVFASGNARARRKTLFLPRKAEEFLPWVMSPQGGGLFFPRKAEGILSRGMSAQGERVFASGYIRARRKSKLCVLPKGAENQNLTF
jgi:hypothetical protein